MDSVSSIPQTATAAATWQSSARRAGLFIAFLIFGLLLFAFGVDGHIRFWTNPSCAFKAGVQSSFT